MRRPDKHDNTNEPAAPLPPWTVRHVPTARPDRGLFPRTAAVMAVCLALLLSAGAADQARIWIGELLARHAAPIYAGDRNGLIQPEKAR